MPTFTRAELIERLRVQLGLLHRAADAYDAGSHDEALNLAVRLRVLLHDTSDSTSLLTLLDVKNTLRFVNTTGGSPTRGGRFVGALLAPIKLTPDDKPQHVALLHEAPRGVDQSFGYWWTTPVIFTATDQFSRKDTISALAHIEGGAHVGKKLTRKYADLRRLGVGFTIGDSTTPVDENPAIPTVRQIAFEVEVTLHERLTDLH